VAISLVAFTVAADVPMARAECATQTVASVLEPRSHELVFTGKVIGITRTAPLGYRATFAVDRVWKGSPGKTAHLYVWELSVETARFVEGQQVLAVATRLTDPRARRDVGLGDSDAVAYAPALCSDSMSLRAVIDGLPADLARPPD
jgi:hypothetical protein